MNKQIKDIPRAEAEQLKPYIVPTNWQGLPPAVVEQLRVYDIYIKSLMLPSSVKTAEQALVIAVTGKELGIPPMMAFKHLYVVGGTPALDGIILQALLIKNGIIWKTIDDFVDDPDVDGMMAGFRNRRTTVKFTNTSNGMEETGSFTKKRAVQTMVSETKQTKLIDKFNYQNWLPEMLWWRAFSIGARRIAGGLMAGIRFADEVDLIIGPDGNVLSDAQVKAIGERSAGGPIKEVDKNETIIIQQVEQPGQEELKAKQFLTSKINKDDQNKETSSAGQSAGGQQ